MSRPLSADPVKREQQIRARFAEVLAVCMISIIPDDLRDYLEAVARELHLARFQEHR